MTETNVTLTAVDGQSLAATLYDPEPRAQAGISIVISSALGVPRHYYAAFAEFLSAEGFAVLTYDVRGNGQSRPRRLKNFEARMSDWGELDMAAAFQWAHDNRPSDRLIAIGHSGGGQLLGLAPNGSLVDGVVTVAAQSGWWGHWTGLKYLPKRLVLRAIMGLLMPGMSALLGHFPGRRIGLFDLPAGVARQWARWCLDPDYLFGDASLDLSGYENFRAPILAFSFADDTYVAPAADKSVIGRFVSATKTWRHIDPADVGAAGIGHFGYFRPACRDTLWADTVNWIKAPNAA